MGHQTSLSLYICFFILSFLKGGSSDFSVTVHLFLSFVSSKRWDFRLLCHCTFVSFFFSFLKGESSDFSVTVHLFHSFVSSKRWDFRLLCHCTFVFYFVFSKRWDFRLLSLYICFFILSFLKGRSSDFSVTVHLFLSFVSSKRWDFRLLCHCTFVSFFCLF